MQAKTTISISEARKNIFDIALEVQKPGIYYTLTEKGKPKVVMMSAEEFESWVETLEVIKEFPNIKDDIKKAEKDFKSGKYKSWVTLEELLAKEGFTVADKPLKKYGISSKSKAKSTKRNK